MCLPSKVICLDFLGSTECWWLRSCQKLLTNFSYLLWPQSHSLVTLALDLLKCQGYFFFSRNTRKLRWELKIQLMLILMLVFRVYLLFVWSLDRVKKFQLIFLSLRPTKWLQLNLMTRQTAIRYTPCCRTLVFIDHDLYFWKTNLIESPRQAYCTAFNFVLSYSLQSL